MYKYEYQNFNYLTFLTLECARKNVANLAAQNIVNVNKNYIFCNCVFQATKRLGITQNISSNQINMDGRSNVYFIDDDFNADPDAVIEFLANYLDSLENSNKFITYENKKICWELK